MHRTAVARFAPMVPTVSAAGAALPAACSSPSTAWSSRCYTASRGPLRFHD